MDGAAVKELAARLQAPAEIGGKVASPPGWTLTDPSTVAGAAAKHLDLYTLGAVRDYVVANRDQLDLATVVAHVVSPQMVRIDSRLRAVDRVRETYVQATAMNLMDGFIGKYLSIEEFIVGVQSRFVEDNTRQSVLRLFGNVKQEAVKTATDDGITQTVTAKSGAVLVTDVAVPNPVTLAPFRTFREVRQPSSLFVLRVQAGHSGGLPTVGLFEADGGAWRLSAISAVHDWLREALPVEVAVLA